MGAAPQNIPWPPLVRVALIAAAGLLTLAAILAVALAVVALAVLA
jgi:hypothetical protein